MAALARSLTLATLSVLALAWSLPGCSSGDESKTGADLSDASAGGGDGTGAGGRGVPSGGGRGGGSAGTPPMGGRAGSSAGGGGASGATSAGGSAGSSAGAGGSTAPDSGTSPPDGCASLPLTGHVIELDTSADLTAALSGAASGDTFLLADGTYALGGKILKMAARQVTLRSKSGKREAVILDGQRSASSGEVIAVTGSDATIADLTIANAYTHAIHVQTTDSADTLRTTIYNVHVLDALEQGIKINLNAGVTHFPDDGVVACSHIELTANGRSAVRNNCYTGGVDAHGARGWRIRDNLIEGFYCAAGLSEHGVHFWTGSRDTIVERNRILNSARGIGFGLGETTGSSSDAWRTYADEPCGGKRPVGHYGGIARNNFIFANDAGLFSSASGFDSGIDLEQACSATAVHNTIYGTTPPLSSAIEWRFANSFATVTNNLANAAFKNRGAGATGTLAGNLDAATAGLFVGAPTGDLHLASSAALARGTGSPVGAGVCDDDIDGDPRSGARDVGADQSTP